MSLYIITMFDTKFVENLGQFHKDVAFASYYPNGFIILKDGTIFINDIEIKFLNSNTKYIIPEISSNAIFNFYYDKPITNVKSYKSIRIKQLYKNIDLVINALNNSFEFYFDIKPKARISDIKLAINSEFKFNDDEIIIYKDGKELIKIFKIKAFSGSNELNLEIKKIDNYITFNLKNYNPDYHIIIDPSVILTSEGNDEIRAIDYDGTYIYATGKTGNSNSFVCK